MRKGLGITKNKKSGTRNRRRNMSMTSSQAPGEGNLAESPELAARGEVTAELRPRFGGRRGGGPW